MNYNQQNVQRYNDIIKLPHPVSKKHPQMSLLNRAAQFAPFAALTGYEDAIRETERLTEERVELDVNHKQILDEKLMVILEQLDTHPKISITYFVPDEKKEGGAYVTVTESIKKIDMYECKVIMIDGTNIKMDDIIDINIKEATLEKYRNYHM